MGRGRAPSPMGAVTGPSNRVLAAAPHSVVNARRPSLCRDLCAPDGRPYPWLCRFPLGAACQGDSDGAIRDGSASSKGRLKWETVIDANQER